MTGQGCDPAVDATMPFDASVPQAARVYDAWLGGKDHYIADRETAARVIVRRPQVDAAEWANRRFQGRTVLLIEPRHDITQIRSVGAGMPTRAHTLIDS